MCAVCNKIHFCSAPQGCKLCETHLFCWHRLNSGFINFRVRKFLFLFTAVQVICAWFAMKFMKWGLLSRLRHVRYTVSPIPAWLWKSCQSFDCVSPVFFRAKIFALKKTGATRSKRRQDFCIHAGIGETVYPKRNSFLLIVLQQKRIYPKRSIISHIPTTVCSECIMMFHSGGFHFVLHSVGIWLAGRSWECQLYCSIRGQAGTSVVSRKCCQSVWIFIWNLGIDCAVLLCYSQWCLQQKWLFVNFNHTMQKQCQKGLQINAKRFFRFKSWG